MPKRRGKKLLKLIATCEDILSLNLHTPAAISRPDPWLSPLFPLHRLEPAGKTPFPAPVKGVIIGAMRMGYGHYRTAIAIASAAAARGITAYLFDPGWFSERIYERMAGLDKWYKLGSRLADVFPLFDKLLWERGTGTTFKSLGSMVEVYKAARLMLPAFLSLPENMPFIGTHSWLSQAAALRGMSPLANAVQDNWPQGFFLSEPGLQCIQGPAAFVGYRLTLDMGIGGRETMPLPAAAVKLTGHFIDQPLLTNLEKDCEARIRRREDGMPKRFVFSLGGAGAQLGMLKTVVQTLAPYIKNGRCELAVNFGDHKNLWKDFSLFLQAIGMKAELHESWDETCVLLTTDEFNNSAGLHIFLSSDVIPAVYTTNLLLPWCDFLITKPGELALYPVPKLILGRIGHHEAYNAYRSSELGDGTPELTTAAHVRKALDAVMRENDILYMMIERIIANYRAGIYSGAQKLLDFLFDSDKHI